MPVVLSKPTRRLRRKTWIGFEVVDVDPDESHAPSDYKAEEDMEAENSFSRKAVYLITLAALRRLSADEARPGLSCPSEWSHADVARVIKNIFEFPLQSNCNASWGTKLELLSFVVFRERHATRDGETAGPYHWHIAVKASESFRFAAYKRALAVNHGVASHWSCSHTGYWSAVRYGFVPSLKKLQADLDPGWFAWSKDGHHPPLFDCSQEPTTSAALKRRRETKVLAAAGAGKTEPRPTEMDFYPIIVQQGFRNTPDDHTAYEKLVQWLKHHGSPALVTFAWKNRQKLAAIIDDVWTWETVDDVLSLHGQTRIELLAAAARSKCGCGGDWYRTAVWTLQRNNINIQALCKDVLKLLQNGRREDTPVLVLMGRLGGEGKSFFYSPLRNVYGLENIQATPQPGNFPLLGLERKKMVLLDEWAFDESVLTLPTQLLWYEGKAFPVTRPQNKEYSGHLLYKGSAPIFATCKEKDLGPMIAKANHALANGHASAYTMLLRRLRVYTFSQPCQMGKQIYECPCCFANMVLSYGA
jgi:hypothetical protein